MTVAATSPREGRGPLDRMLAPFAEVHAGEGATALLLMLNVFLLLTCYYIIKPVREALILAGEGAEAKSYASAAIVVMLLFFVPAYGALANRLSRIKLITWVTLFHIACLAAFYALALAKLPHLGIAFFVWVGVFNVSIIAQFWSYANDLYTPAEGKRLFAIIAFGSTAGAILGSAVTKAMIKPVGVNQLMLVAAAILAVCIVLSRIVDAREHDRVGAREAAAEDAPVPDTGGGFKLVFAQRYLFYIAMMMLLVNYVNTNGEYILGKTLSSLADRLVAAGQTGGVAPDEFKKTYIGGFYAGFFTWVNVVTAIVQLFIVSRFLKWFGVRTALFVMPLISLTGYAALALAPAIGLIRTVKIAENSTDYSLQNTSRQALFLPTSREAKYKAKAAIDTFFYRAGDLCSAGTVFVGSMLTLSPQKFAAINVALVALWLLSVALIAREHKKLVPEG